MSFWLCKSTATFLFTRYVLTINETFQMRCCTNVYLRGHQNYNKSKSKASKNTNLTSVPFCRGRSILPARCELHTSLESQKQFWKNAAIKIGKASSTVCQNWFEWKRGSFIRTSFDTLWMKLFQFWLLRFFLSLIHIWRCRRRG